MAYEYLPAVTWAAAAGTAAVVPRDTLQATAASPADQQLTVAAENAPLRILYGRVRIGAQIADLLSYAGQWLVIAIWGDGPIDAVESVTLGDAALPAGASVTHYLGSAGQAADATLIAAYAAAGVAYVDALPGVAYSVFSFPADALGAGLSINAVVRGRRCYDPRTGTTDYTACPSLCLAEFLATYGGFTVNAASLAAAANANDEAIGGKPRRSVGLSIDSVQAVVTWADTLRAYAGCYIVPQGNELLLIPDRPVAGVTAIEHGAGQIARISPLRLRGVKDAPTVITLEYTDVSALPWKSARVVAKLPGVDAGVTPRRESLISMPGVQDSAQALREATERLNKLTLSDLSFDLDLFDEALSITPGDVLAVTHPIGVSSKPMRVLDLSGTLGRYALKMSEYDPSVYSDAVETVPSSPDTTLPNPAAPPALADFSLVEEPYQKATGIWASRLRMTWAAPAYVYLRGYRVEIYDGADLVFSDSPADPVAVTPELQEGTLYTARVAVVSSIGQASAWRSKSITALGKYLIPGNVPALSAFEAGGEVRSLIEPAVDIDIWKYEYRYVAVAGTWAAGTLIDRIDSLRLTTRVMPAGTWDLMVKAIDSVGQYSATEARTTVTVSLDTGSFLVESVDFVAPALTNMTAFRLTRTDPKTYYVTTDGASWNSQFTAALNSYSNPLLTYHASVTSGLLTEAHDFGTLIAGNWTGETDAVALSGSIAQEITLSPDGSAYTGLGAMSAKTSGRFAKLSLSASGSATLLASAPLLNLRVDATPMTESGVSTSLASGGKRISLSKVYTAAKSIPITPYGTTACSYSVDAVTVGASNYFDVYIFDASGAQIARDFGWTFEGV